jgi:hypothetical protein
MRTPDDFGVNDVYSYKSSEDLTRYYNDWAHAYNSYCDEVGYALPRIVASTFAKRYKSDWGWVLDIGSGTGLVGMELQEFIPKIDIHGIDASIEMAKFATATGAYHWCSVIDLKVHDKTLLNPINSGRSYRGLLSAGTFTPGHLDQNDLIRLFPLLEENALVVISVKKNHYEDCDFGSTLISLSASGEINKLEIIEKNAYNSDFIAPNYIVSFFKK